MQQFCYQGHLYRAATLREAAKRIMYHGTATGQDNEILRNILKQGLNPNPKRRVFDKTEDETDWHKRSIETLGGVYFTEKPQDANSFANGARRKFGGNNVIVIAQIETRSPETRVDEDMLFGGRDFFYNVYKRTTRGLLANEYGTLQDLIAGIDWNDVAALFIEEQIKPRWPVTEQRVKAVLPLVAEALRWQTEYWLAKNIDSAGWSVKHQYEEEYTPVDPGEALQQYRNAADRAMQKLRETTDRPKDRWMYRIRVTEPVGFSGANRILAVLRYRGYVDKGPYDSLGEVVYGDANAAKAFIDGMARFSGPYMQWVDQHGNTLYDEPKESAQEKAAQHNAEADNTMFLYQGRLYREAAPRAPRRVALQAPKASAIVKAMRQELKRAQQSISVVTQALGQDVVAPYLVKLGQTAEQLYDRDRAGREQITNALTGAAERLREDNEEALAALDTIETIYSRFLEVESFLDQTDEPEDHPARKLIAELERQLNMQL